MKVLKHNVVSKLALLYMISALKILTNYLLLSITAFDLNLAGVIRSLPTIAINSVCIKTLSSNCKIVNSKHYIT